MKCYKVVKEVNNKYYSSYIKNESVKLEYPIGDWVKPKVGKIFAFVDIEEALDYKEYLAGCKLFIAEAQGVEKADFLLEVDYVDDIRYIKKFWLDKDMYKIYYKYGIVTKCDESVILCDKIKLLEEVK